MKKMLGRLGVTPLLHLSPEGHTLNQLKCLTRSLLLEGQRIFVLSFHSPSIVPGHTPYVSSPQDAQTFLVTLEGYLRYFAEELDGEFTSPGGVRTLVRTL